ncbi:hypothetical protein [Photorhabdus hindustanensis]|uniref:hypothetical protein n=1 Tax=Photorhabdus hindustanensis TaxID=2918802 RepID=UPI0011B021D1|nr:hypothetical protein [Photorhabdus hindustanensis]
MKTLPAPTPLLGSDVVPGFGNCLISSLALLSSLEASPISPFCKAFSAALIAFPAASPAPGIIAIAVAR